MSMDLQLNNQNRLYVVFDDTPKLGTYFDAEEVFTDLTYDIMTNKLYFSFSRIEGVTYVRSNASAGLYDSGLHIFSQFGREWLETEDLQPVPVFTMGTPDYADLDCVYYYYSYYHDGEGLYNLRIRRYDINQMVNGGTYVIESGDVPKYWAGYGVYGRDGPFAKEAPSGLCVDDNNIYVLCEQTKTAPEGQRETVLLLATISKDFDEGIPPAITEVARMKQTDGYDEEGVHHNLSDDFFFYDYSICCNDDAIFISWYERIVTTTPGFGHRMRSCLKRNAGGALHVEVDWTAEYITPQGINWCGIICNEKYLFTKENVYDISGGAFDIEVSGIVSYIDGFGSGTAGTCPRLGMGESTFNINGEWARHVIKYSAIGSAVGCMDLDYRNIFTLDTKYNANTRAKLPNAFIRTMMTQIGNDSYMDEDGIFGGDGILLDWDILEDEYSTDIIRIHWATVLAQFLPYGDSDDILREFLALDNDPSVWLFLHGRRASISTSANARQQCHIAMDYLGHTWFSSGGGYRKLNQEYQIMNVGADGNTELTVENYGVLACPENEDWKVYFQEVSGFGGDDWGPDDVAVLDNAVLICEDAASPVIEVDKLTGDIVCGVWIRPVEDKEFFGYIQIYQRKATGVVWSLVHISESTTPRQQMSFECDSFGKIWAAYIDSSLNKWIGYSQDGGANWTFEIQAFGTSPYAQAERIEYVDGNVYLLDGTKTFNDDGGGLVLYDWSQVAGPIGVIDVEFESCARVRLPDVAEETDFVFRLTVNGLATSDVTITLSP